MSCQKTTVIKDESEFKDPLRSRDRIYIRTTDCNDYFFSAYSYRVKNDTLSGEGQKIIGLDLMEEPEFLNIACHDIIEIKTKKLDPWMTIGGGMVLAGVLYWHLFWAKMESP
jgi:hypothetical protein